MVKSRSIHGISFPDEHDLIVSRISHLPHVIAMTLVNFIDKNKGISYLPFVGGGFRGHDEDRVRKSRYVEGYFIANKRK